MPLRLWFDLAMVLHLAEAAVAAHQRVDIDGTVVTHAPPALHLMRDCGGDLDDRLYIDGNAHPSLWAGDVDAEPFRRRRPGRRYDHGISWTEWLGSPPRRGTPIQVPIALLDVLRAGHAAGFDMFTVDADGDLLQPAVARRRPRGRRSRRDASGRGTRTVRPCKGRPTPLPGVRDHR